MRLAASQRLELGGNGTSKDKASRLDQLLDAEGLLPHSWKEMQHPSLQLHTLKMWTLGEYTLLQAHSHAYGPHILLGLIGWIQILDDRERTEIKAFSYTQTTWV